jgi:hypothetical protein
MIDTFAASRGNLQAQLIEVRDMMAGNLIDMEEIDPIIALVQHLPDPDDDADSRILFEHQVFVSKEYQLAAALLTQVFTPEEAAKIQTAVTRIPSRKHKDLLEAYVTAVNAEHLTHVEADYIVLARVLLEYSKAYRGIPGDTAFF